MKHQRKGVTEHNVVPFQLRTFSSGWREKTPQKNNVTQNEIKVQHLYYLI